MTLKHFFSGNRLQNQGAYYKWVNTPGAPLLNFNDGEVWQRFIFYTQKNHNFRICLPKKITTLFSIPRKIPLSFFRNPQKIPLFLFVTQKNSGIFHRPKRITLGQNFRPKKIPRTPPPSLKHVSGAPGVNTVYNLYFKESEVLIVEFVQF